MTFLARVASLRAFPFALVILVVALVPSARASEEKPLIFCAMPASLPRIGKTPDGQPEGIDAALAKSLGRHLGRRVEFHWW